MLRTHAVRVASEAAQLVADAREAALSDISTKSSATDVVTSGDRAVERLIRERLDEMWPGVPVIGEEEGGQAPEHGLSWVVDPIDGTVNYLYGYPCYAVSVAAQVDGVSVAGAVADPVGDRMWTASRGDGARLNGRPLSVSSATRLELTLVATGFAYAAERRVRQAALWAALLPRVRDLRRPGASSLDLCAVAAGWVDAYVEHGLHRWDWAAGALIAEEAGAVVRLPSTANEDGLGADAVFVATPGIADALRAALLDSGAGKV
ncbi:MAG TPA: inositol monophosphatase family protein [Pseudonocardiaceae bacterium]|jgi:myo-inositol-1(or 4)-monophosphatase|nr:inositol monophosphatase family protein [Pseudonocardiaceae bacterium]